jgi:hypothetical protein
MRVSRSRAPSSGLGEEVDEVFDFAVRGPRSVTGSKTPSEYIFSE